FFFLVPPPSALFSLSLHDALPIWFTVIICFLRIVVFPDYISGAIMCCSMVLFFNALYKMLRFCFRINPLYVTNKSGFLYSELIRSEEHTSELQSRFDLVCRLLLEK